MFRFDDFIISPDLMISLGNQAVQLTPARAFRAGAALLRASTQQMREEALRVAIKPEATLPKRAGRKAL